MQTPAPNSSELNTKSVNSPPGSNDSLDETLCAAAEETASLDKLLKAAAQLPVPSEAEEQQWAGVLSRVQDLDFVRKQSRTIGDSSSSENAPETLGPFELLECLGEGGMGAVYRARHLRLGKLMAVKVMHSHRLDDQELRSRFYREMRALGQLQHPNIVSAQHADEVDGVPYLAMEYVDGISLAGLFQRLTVDEQPVPIAVVCELIRQAAEGIQYAHDQGVLHRDLKPGNLMLDHEGRVRVLDLGLARMTESIDSGESTGNDEHLTSQHQILGTPGYMAPEQLTRGHEMDTRTDVYALGATAFYLLTGKRVHAYSNSESIVQHAMRVVAEPAPNVKSLRSDIPEELAQLIAHALEREPAQRLQSAGELARGLSRWSSKESLRGLWIDGQTAINGVSNSMLDTERLPESAFPVRQSAAEAATVIMPAAESQLSSGSNGRLRATWLIPAGFFAIILLAGVFLKLRTKDGGELIIQSDDPDAKISIAAVKGEQSEELQLVEQDDRTLKLTQGKWAIHIEGPEASGFELSEDTIVVSPGSRHEILVTRRKAGDTVEMADAPRKTDASSSQQKNAASTPKKTPETPMEKVSTAADSVPAAAASTGIVANGQIDWTPGRMDRIGWGLVPQPANLDNVATWQMQLLRPPTGMYGSWYSERQVSLDRQRQLVATCDEYGAKVTRISDGRVLNYFHRSDGTSFTSIAFSSDGALLLLSSDHEFEIRRRDGRLVNRYRADNSLYKYYHSHLSTTWMPSGDILAWTHTGAIVYSAEAKILHELSVHDETKTPWLQYATVNPDGSEILFSGLDNSIFKWTLGESGLKEVLTVDEAASCQAVWSPNGQQILVMTQGGENLSSLWSPNGTRLATGKLPLHFGAWSPDGRFLVDGNHRVFSSETLDLLRTLELPTRPGHFASLFTPFWPAADEIVLVSQSPGRLYASGTVLRFHPSGRRISSSEPPQLLSVGAATLGEEDVVHTAHLSSLGFCSLGFWDKTGRPLGVKFTETQQAMRDDGFSWNPVSGHIAMTHGAWGPVNVLDPDGNTVRSIPVRGLKLAWSGDGKRLSMVDHTDHEAGPFGKIAIYGESSVPEFESPLLPGYTFAPKWSPDGRWLVWDLLDDAVPEQAQLHLVDMHSNEKTVQNIVLPSTAGMRWMEFSPDSKWLAIHNNTPPHQGACLLRMADLKIFEKKPETTSSTWNAHAGCWSSDSRRVVMGDLYDVDPDSGLNRTGTFYCDGLRHQLLAFTPDNKALWTESPYDRKFGIKDSDGQQIAEFAASGILRAGHASPYQARLQSEDNLLFLTIPAWPSEHMTSTGLLNLKEPGIRWTGLAYDNGQQITIGPGGEILHGPENIDQYVIHTINYPGGVTMPVTRQELIERATASAEQKAILWASDLRAVIRMQDAAEPWTAEPALAVSEFPAAASVVELDFSGHLQIADAELQHLPRFANLVKLSLANTTLSVVPDCSGLLSLAELDLSQTKITSLTGIQNCQSLRRLELSGLQLDAASWQTIGANAGLQSLNLSNTILDSLSALDLYSLKSLQHLDVRGTKLTDSDITSLKAALPGCQVLSGPMLEPEKL